MIHPKNNQNLSDRRRGAYGLADQLFQFGEWQVDARAGFIRKGPLEKKLPPRVMELLLILAGNPGNFFTREEIEDKLWPAGGVGPESLNNNIAKLRRALEDDPQNARYIETIPKRGYRILPKIKSPGQRRTHHSKFKPVFFWSGAILATTALILVANLTVSFFSKTKEIHFDSAGEVTVDGKQYEDIYAYLDSENAVFEDVLLNTNEEEKTDPVAD